MTRNKDFKRIVRERSARTGESYSAARRTLTTSTPSLRGWHITGPGDGSPHFRLTGYEGGLDPNEQHAGLPLAFLASTVENPKSHAVVMQSVAARIYRGKRIQFAAWTRSADAKTQGGLWVRVTATDRDTTLGYGRFTALPTWEHGSVVLDVPAESVSILFGLLLLGTGRVWMGGASFAAVSHDIPLTQASIEPDEPVNLTFQD